MLASVNLLRTEPSDAAARPARTGLTAALGAGTSFDSHMLVQLMAAEGGEPTPAKATPEYPARTVQQMPANERPLNDRPRPNRESVNTTPSPAEDQAKTGRAEAAQDASPRNQDDRVEAEADEDAPNAERVDDEGADADGEDSAPPVPLAGGAEPAALPWLVSVIENQNGTDTVAGSSAADAIGDVLGAGDTSMVGDTSMENPLDLLRNARIDDTTGAPTDPSAFAGEAVESGAPIPGDGGLPGASGLRQTTEEEALTAPAPAAAPILEQPETLDMTPPIIPARAQPVAAPIAPQSDSPLSAPPQEGGDALNGSDHPAPVASEHAEVDIVPPAAEKGGSSVPHRADPPTQAMAPAVLSAPPAQANPPARDPLVTSKPTAADGIASANTDATVAMAASASTGTPSGDAGGDGDQGTGMAFGQALATATGAVKSDKTAAVPAHAVSEQVAVEMVRAARSGVSRIHVTLEPDALGRLDIRLDINRHGQISAVITADNPQTVELLRQEAKSLEQSLNNAGFKTEAGGLNFGFRPSGDGLGQNPQGYQSLASAAASGRSSDEAGGSPELAPPPPPRPVASGRLDIQA